MEDSRGRNEAASRDELKLAHVLPNSYHIIIVRMLLFYLVLLNIIIGFQIRERCNNIIITKESKV